MNVDTQYKTLVEHILNYGDYRENRTGIGAFGVFGCQMRFDLAEGFPLLTTKKVRFRSVLHELLWFIRGETNIRYLKENGVSIWDEWADANGELGPIYGRQWRNWPMHDGHSRDQLQRVIDSIRRDPLSRRHIVSAWNVCELDGMALPPCHVMFQFYVRGGKYLDCQLYQRSADVGLGVPFNIASYALLTEMVALITGYLPGELVWSGGDVHIYANHEQALREQITRQPRALPHLLFDNGVKEIDDFTADSVTLLGYDPHPPIKMQVSV